SASTIPCLGVLRAYRSNQPPSSGETTAVVPSLSVNVTNCLSGMIMRNSNRRLNVEEHGQTVRQHRRKLSEGRVFVTWLFGVLLEIEIRNLRSFLPKQIQLRRRAELLQFLAFGAVARRLAHVAFGREFRFFEVAQYFLRPVQHGL